MSDHYDRYADVKRAIDEAPVTWIPALLIAVVSRAVRDEVFQGSGLLITVEKAMDAAKGRTPAGQVPSSTEASNG